ADAVTVDFPAGLPVAAEEHAMKVLSGTGYKGRRVRHLSLLCALLGVSACGGNGANKTSGNGSGNGGAGGAGGGASGSAGAGAGSGTNSSSGTGTSSSGGSCKAGLASLVKITEIDVGATVVHNEDEAALKPLAISPIPSGGSRVAWMGNDGKVHVTTLDASDHVTGASVGLLAHDFSDLHADDGGGVLLLTRDAKGGGTLNCGMP